MVGWGPLQGASEINDILTSTSGASLRLHSLRFRNTSRLKSKQGSAKQKKCPTGSWEPGQQLPFSCYSGDRLPQGPSPDSAHDWDHLLFLPGRGS